MTARSMTLAESKALIAASQASEAVAALVMFASEGPLDHRTPFGDREVLELLADALKIAIAAEREGFIQIDVAEHADTREASDQLTAALEKFLEGWA